MHTSSPPPKLNAVVTRIHAHGLDEASEQLARFMSVRYVQLERGMASSFGEFAALETIAVGQLSADRHKVEWLDVPPGRLLMVAPVRGRARAGTARIGPGQIVLAHGPTQLVMCTEGGYASWFVSMPDRNPGKVIGKGVRFLRGPTSGLETFDSCARRMIEAAENGSSSGVVLDLCNGWLSQARDEDATVTASAARCQAAVRARQYIDDHLDRPLTLASVCQASYSSPRALEYGFREIFGVSPITYIRCARLSRVRRELYSSPYTSGKITQLALQWGFWHLSQFSKDYFDLFGELPSITLGRASGRAHSNGCNCVAAPTRVAVAEPL
nr:helix-turn-helix domain-containing protein [uncultured Steroidobacter sp.]